jgi:Tol biopolymer transport system component
MEIYEGARVMQAHRISIALVTLIVAAVSTGYAQQTAEEVYQAALYQEEVQGNLEGAIDAYERILADFRDNRSVAAKAQLHIGLCFEKLGLTEAQQAYRRVIADYPDHTDEVAVARERLNSLERELAELNRQPTFRKIEFASEPQNGVMSPDGKKLAFTSDDAVWVVPLQGNVSADIAGEPVRIADVPGAWNFMNLLGWSADGAWIAVNGGGLNGDDVFLVPAAGGEPRMIRLPVRGVGYFSGRLSLSPDGEYLAFSAQELGTLAEEEGFSKLKVFVIPTRGGEPRQISSDLGMLPAFSPDGEHIAYVTFREKDEPPENIQSPRYNSELWVVRSSGGSAVKLASVDGRLAGPVWSPDGSFVAAQSRTDLGGKEISVFPLSPDVSSAGEPTEIALPGMSLGTLAGWTPEGELGVFIRSPYRSAVYTIPSSGGRAVQVTPEGVPYYPRWSPDGARIFLRWVQEDEEPPVKVAHVPAAGGDVTEVPWPEKALITQVPGGGHNISPDGRTLIVSGREAPYGPEKYMDLWVIPLDDSRARRLTNDESHESYACWSPDGRSVAFLDRHVKPDGGGFNAVYVILAEGGDPRRVTSEADSVDFGGISFSPDGERVVYFSDGAIMTKPIGDGAPDVLVPEVRHGRHSQLAYSPDGSKIAHNADGKIWITRLATGETAELQTGLPEDFHLSEFGWSPDGAKITFMTTSGDEPEFWLISDFLPSDEGR